ncbi:DUF485 domain-containing protein [Metasolibacillus meyeri]|uniref:DUF485 domain-containing protein n=1 Tax=Metasolibacillus meyeri TaxID=1071052 RepID=UPI000D3094D3|nr:DUF485 domain-containing protein [Metasolibacillus meyeri]
MSTSSLEKNGINFEKINQMESFNAFVKKKNKLLFTITAAFLTFYIFLPILAFTTVLQQNALGSITWVWLYSAALFIMTVVLCTVYGKIAAKLDREVQAILAEYEGGN